VTDLLVDRALNALLPRSCRPPVSSLQTQLTTSHLVLAAISRNRRYEQIGCRPCTRIGFARPVGRQSAKILRESARRRPVAVSSDQGLPTQCRLSHRAAAWGCCIPPKAIRASRGPLPSARVSGGTCPDHCRDILIANVSRSVASEHLPVVSLGIETAAITSVRGEIGFG